MGRGVARKEVAKFCEETIEFMSVSKNETFRGKEEFWEELRMGVPTREELKRASEVKYNSEDDFLADELKSVKRKSKEFPKRPFKKLKKAIKRKPSVLILSDS